MAERRLDPRMSCYLRGEIIVHMDADALPCEVHDISDKGMRLSGVDFSQLPEIFTLNVPRRKLCERVRVVRRGEDGLGVVIL